MASTVLLLINFTSVLNYLEPLHSSSHLEKEVWLKKPYFDVWSFLRSNFQLPSVFPPNLNLRNLRKTIQRLSLSKNVCGVLLVAALCVVLCCVQLASRLCGRWPHMRQLSFTGDQPKAGAKIEKKMYLRLFVSLLSAPPRTTNPTAAVE